MIGDYICLAVIEHQNEAELVVESKVTERSKVRDRSRSRDNKNRSHNNNERDREEGDRYKRVRR